MGFFLSIFILILAFIIFLSIYLILTRRENSMESKMQVDKTDFEVSEEPGITGLSSGDSFIETKKTEIENNEIWNNRYNKTIVRLLVRDPHNLFAYWEIIQPEYYQYQPLLRLFNVNDNSFIDIEISHHSDNWYLTDVKENNKYKIAIGYKKDNIFYPLCYSDTVNTPSARPSDIIDEKWMSIKELSKYTYRIEINSTLSLIKSLKKRKKKEELMAGSLMFTRRK